MKKAILISAIVFATGSLVNAQEVIKEKDAKEHKEVKDEKEAKGGKNVKGQPKGQQTMKTPEERAQKSVNHLDKAVGLTAEQKTKVYDLALTRAKKVDEVRAKYKGQPGSKETAKNEIIAIKKEYRQGVKAVLTPEQMEKLKARAADAGTGQGQGHDKGGKGMKGGKGEKGMKGEKDGKGEKNEKDGKDEDEKLIGDED